MNRLIIKSPNYYSNCASIMILTYECLRLPDEEEVRPILLDGNETMCDVT
jgi:hypothetical protein